MIEQVEQGSVFIYGAPGVGKTTYSVDLQKRLGIELMEGDYLREVIAQKEKTEEEDPFVYVGTKEAYRKFGELNEENVVKGLKAVRSSMAPYVEQEIGVHQEPFILEAAFLDPANLVGKGRLVLIVTTDESQHYGQYYRHRTKDKYSEDTFQSARMIQTFLINEAKSLSVEIVENNFEFEPI